MSFNTSRVQRRQLKRDNRGWPDRLVEVPREQWPPNPQPNLIRALRSSEFLVQVFQEDGCLRLSVNRTEIDGRTGRWREDITWDDLQRLKAEAGYGERWASEVFPADAEVVNVANMRHLFILEAPPAYAWKSKR